MPKFPVDAPRKSVLKALKKLGFDIIREGNHISMIRTDKDGIKTPLTIPNHSKIKSSTLRTICSQCGITRDEFLKAYHK